MNILIAGGAGYIGSHTAVVLLDAGHEVSIVDSLVNSQRSVIDRIQDLANKQVAFFQADIRDRKALNDIFSELHVDAVINFAGHKAVGESVEKPLEYYDNNLNCAIALLECMAGKPVKTFLFSSSAAVYGKADRLPIDERAEIAPQSPYGRTKYQIEQILRDLNSSDPSWKIGILRYFNPVGAHPSGMIGEDPNGIPNNLMPCIAQVAAGKLEKLKIFGNDYETADGTGVRDYIHVMDLAKGHAAALAALDKAGAGKVLTLNLGTGRGYSVLEVIRSFEANSGRTIPCEFVERRPGDVDACFADPGLARIEIGWQAVFGIEEVCRDAWNWQLKSDQ